MKILSRFRFSIYLILMVYFLNAGWGTWGDVVDFGCQDRRDAENDRRRAEQLAAMNEQRQQEYEEQQAQEDSQFGDGVGVRGESGNRDSQDQDVDQFESEDDASNLGSEKGDASNQELPFGS